MEKSRFSLYEVTYVLLNSLLGSKKLTVAFIFLQCHNGHTLCSTCKTKVQNWCPTCKQELGDGKTPLEASGIAIRRLGTVMCIPDVCSWGISKSCVDACCIFLCQMYPKLSSILLLYWNPYSLTIDNFPYSLKIDRINIVTGLRKF